MKAKEILFFQKKLMAWYLANHRALPWRKTKDPYRIWVSEVMLQQTQVNTVLPYYREFLQKFPTLKHLARASLHDVLKVWEGLGYYGRARNLHRAAQEIIARFNGIIPDSREALLDQLIGGFEDAKIKLEIRLRQSPIRAKRPPICERTV